MIEDHVGLAGAVALPELAENGEVECLPASLAAVEAEGVERLQRQRQDERRRNQAAADEVRRRAGMNWLHLHRCLLHEMPGALHPYLPYRDMPEGFTEDSTEWQVSVALPGGRPPITALFTRPEGADSWTRGLFAGDHSWLVQSWYLQPGGGIEADTYGGAFARDLPEALALARAEALRRRELEEKALPAPDRGTLPEPPLRCSPQERQLLDALSNYLWHNTLGYDLADNPYQETPHE